MRAIEMGMTPYLFFLFWFFGFIFFWKVYYPRSTRRFDETSSKLSIIIPARNEEKNLGRLFRSIKDQALKTHEIIVVDDHSEDLTAEVGRMAGCIVISSKDLPEGWTGKPWACWQGAHKATGNIFAFLDADTFLESDGLSRIFSTYLDHGGLLSIQPFHRMEKIYERLSAIFNIAIMVGMNSFTLWGSRRKPPGAFGPCMVCSREDYFAVGGHEKVRGEILESISFGKEFLKAGREVRCYGGKGTISFRMYPEGLRSLIEGFGKGFGIGANAMSLVSLFMMVCWVTGGVAVTRHLLETAFWPDKVALGVWMTLDAFYILQIHWMLRRIGNFGFLTALLFQIPLLFFIVLFFSSLLRIFVIRRVTWKGREIKTGEGERHPS
jgi:4,4'-diaponeurosporenoate glycosyltransferase